MLSGLRKPFSKVSKTSKHNNSLNRLNFQQRNINIPSIIKIIKNTLRINKLERLKSVTNIREILLDKSFNPDYQKVDQEIGTKNGDEKLILHGNPLCPYTQRVWIALLEKDIKFHFQMIYLGIKKPEWFIKLNSDGSVPIVEVDDQIVRDSFLILEYLEEEFVENPIRKDWDPVKKAAERLFIMRIESIVKNLTGFLHVKNEFQHVHRAVAQFLVVQISKEISTRSDGPFLFGSEVSLADICMYPLVLRIKIALKHYKDFDLMSVKGGEKLKDWFAACSRRKSFKKSSFPRDYYLKDLKKRGIRL